MKFTRRAFLRPAVAAAALARIAQIAGAQSYPSRPLTMIVTFAAGGATISWRGRVSAPTSMVMDGDCRHLSAEVTIDEPKECLEQAAFVLRGAGADLGSHQFRILAAQAYGSFETLVVPGCRACTCPPFARECAASILADICLPFYQPNIQRRSLTWGNLDDLHCCPTA